MYNRVEFPDGTRRRMITREGQTRASIPHGSRVFRLDNLTATAGREGLCDSVEFEGQSVRPPSESTLEDHARRGWDDLTSSAG